MLTFNQLADVGRWRGLAVVMCYLLNVVSYGVSAAYGAHRNKRPHLALGLYRHAWGANPDNGKTTGASETYI